MNVDTKGGGQTTPAFKQFLNSVATVLGLPPDQLLPRHNDDDACTKDCADRLKESEAKLTETHAALRTAQAHLQLITPGNQYADFVFPMASEIVNNVQSFGSDALGKLLLEYVCKVVPAPAAAVFVSSLLNLCNEQVNKAFENAESSVHKALGGGGRTTFATGIILLMLQENRKLIIQAAPALETTELLSSFAQTDSNKFFEDTNFKKVVTDFLKKSIALLSDIRLSDKFGEFDLSTVSGEAVPYDSSQHMPLDEPMKNKPTCIVVFPALITSNEELKVKAMVLPVDYFLDGSEGS
jgi:hypothetical protein